MLPRYALRYAYNVAVADPLALRISCIMNSKFFLVILNVFEIFRSASILQMSDLYARIVACEEQTAGRKDVYDLLIYPCHMSIFDLRILSFVTSGLLCRALYLSQLDMAAADYAAILQAHGIPQICH
jgi:hypothetical protein